MRLCPVPTSPLLKPTDGLLQNQTMRRRPVPHAYREALIKELTPLLYNNRKLTDVYYTQKRKGVPADPQVSRISAYLGCSTPAATYDLSQGLSMPISSHSPSITRSALYATALSGISSAVPILHAHVRLPYGLSPETWKGVWVDLVVPTNTVLDCDTSAAVDDRPTSMTSHRTSLQAQNTYRFPVAPTLLGEKLRLLRSEAQKRCFIASLMVVQRFSTRQPGSQRVTRPDMLSIVYTFDIADTAGGACVYLMQVSDRPQPPKPAAGALNIMSQAPSNATTPSLITPGVDQSVSSSDCVASPAGFRPSPSTLFASISPISTPSLSSAITSTTSSFTRTSSTDISLYPSASATAMDFSYPYTYTYTEQFYSPPFYPHPYLAQSYHEAPYDCIPPAPIPLPAEFPIHMPRPQQQIILQSSRLEMECDSVAQQREQPSTTCSQFRTSDTYQPQTQHPVSGAPMQYCPTYLAPMTPSSTSLWQHAARLHQMTTPGSSALAGWNRMPESARA